MPSPFPGMDPYLENPAFWGSVHNHLIVAIQEFLAGPLEPKYYVLEIDLLRAGQRDPWTAGKSDYCVLLARAEKRNRADLWLFNLRQPLPVLPVPLQAPDPDIPLPLAEILQTVYDRGRYYNIVDYNQPPTPPLPEAEAAWAAALLEGN